MCMKWVHLYIYRPLMTLSSATLDDTDILCFYQWWS